MKFRSVKVLAAFIGGSLCFSAAVSAQATPDATRPQTGTAAPGAGASASVERMNDTSIVAIVLAIDSNEIMAANAAEKKQMGKEAMSYAKMLGKQHKEDAKAYEKMVKKQKLTATMIPKTAQDLRAKGSSELTAMASLTGKEFEKAYIDAMVTGHTEALQVIDSQLIPNAQNDALKKQLAKTRSHVAEHLEHGKRLQNAQASAPQ